jgi:hypothetical protein
MVNEREFGFAKFFGWRKTSYQNSLTGSICRISVPGEGLIPGYFMVSGDDKGDGECRNHRLISLSSFLSYSQKYFEDAFGCNDTNTKIIVYDYRIVPKIVEYESVPSSKAFLVGNKNPVLDKPGMAFVIGDNGFKAGTMYPNIERRRLYTTVFDEEEGRPRYVRLFLDGEYGHIPSVNYISLGKGFGNDTPALPIHMELILEERG